MMLRLSVLLLAVATGCVSGSKIRADGDVLQAELERARRNGAYRCAPKELAQGEANLDFARGELAQGNSGRADQHIKLAAAASKQALLLSRDCGPKQVLVREQQTEQPRKSVVRIQETDQDGDGVGDRTDLCPDQPEDKDGFLDDDGCPEPDNDSDGVLDGNDKCPLLPGPLSNQGCPEETPKDRDGDGIPDPADKCVDQAEDKDGFRDEDGCPDPDNDGDGLLDAADKCPDQAGPIANIGCPVTDKDGDGINDNQDKCPAEPEDKDGFQDEDGCPDLDNDADGVPDTQDKCPNDAGPAENSGCPVKDKDRDGVPDAEDKCPEEAGPKQTSGCPVKDQDQDGIPDNEDKCPTDPGTKEEGGCPKKYARVVVKKDRIEIKQQIKFKTGSAKIVGKDSFATIADVAQAMRDNPRILKLRVEGHTDSVGNDAKNLKLSQGRADAVMAELIRDGVDPGRVQAVGFGETQPIASNSSAKGRAENRRTEFNVVEPTP